MDLMEILNKNLVQTMKGKEENRELVISVLRMIKSSVKNAEIAKRGSDKDLTDDDLVGILSTMVKQRKESVEQYTKADRNDLADKEKKEIEIIQTYLPEQLTGEALEDIIRSVIQETGVTGLKEVGKLMKELMPRVKGKADGKLVSQRARDILEKMG